MDRSGDMPTPSRWRKAPAPITTMVAAFPVIAFRGLSGGLPILIGLFIGRTWGLQSLGSYSFASSFAAVGLVFADWGCMRWLPRELALCTHESSRAAILSQANAVRLVISAGYLALTVLLALTGNIDSASALYAYEFGALYVVIICSTNGLSARLADGEIRSIGWAVAAGLLTFIACGTAVVGAGGGPHHFLAAYIAGKIVEAAVLMGPRPSLLRVSPRGGLVIAKALAPFSLQAILGIIYSRLSIFVVQHERPLSDVGIVGAASALQNVLLLIPTSIALLYYPALTTAAARGDGGRLKRIIAGSGVASVAGVSAGLIVLVVLRKTICTALHVPQDHVTFVIAFVAIAYLTIGTTLAGVSLQAFGGERLAARLSFLTLTLALVYQYSFLRAAGLWGIVLAVFAAELTSLVVFGFAATARGRHVLGQR